LRVWVLHEEEEVVAVVEVMVGVEEVETGLILEGQGTEGHPHTEGQETVPGKGEILMTETEEAPHQNLHLGAEIRADQETRPLLEDRGVVDPLMADPAIVDTMNHNKEISLLEGQEKEVLRTQGIRVTVGMEGQEVPQAATLLTEAHEMLLTEAQEIDLLRANRTLAKDGMMIEVPREALSIGKLNGSWTMNTRKQQISPLNVSIKVHLMLLE
jgi:hypothetical protein